MCFGAKIMMPSAPMMTMPSSKPKIGFSIESIVGNHFKNKSPIHYSHDSEGSEAPLSPLSDYGYPNQQKSPRLPTSPAEIHRALRLNEFSQMELHNRMKRSLSSSPAPGATDILEHHKNMQRLSEQAAHDSINHHHIQQIKMQQLSPGSPQQTRLSAEDSINRRSRSPPSPLSSPHHQNSQKGNPIMVPGMAPAGLVRPSPLQAPPPGSMNDMRSQMPAYPAEMFSAAQNHFFRLSSSKLLPP